VPGLRALLSRRACDYAAVERILGQVPALPESRPLESYDPDVVEDVSRDVRAWVGIEEAPLHDALSLLEDKGLKVLLHPLPQEVSGFSAYTDELGGVIFVNESHPVERQFFTAFHELAHLIFHRREYKEPTGKLKRNDPREKAANHLAGAILLPKEALLRELRSYHDRWMPERLLIEMKLRYQVSMRTVLVRAEQAGLLSKKQTGQQIGAIDKKYGEHAEPVELPRSQIQTRLTRLVFAALMDERITTSRAAEIMGRPLAEVGEELTRWIEGDPM
jgi:Zn-dependent peptidase ImmA (M78 family)